ncbi:hypothetical protein QFV42_RS18680 [Escherichia coli]|uniref:hypothetical protein n=1 Tax=Enterobacter hormaechei TaxID=158836 RepID=UPI001C23C3E4|nr:hypothetical protein [Enterobacter hormaechei]EKP9142083.1 hypothetical protein [Escherichia coli]EKP9354511.1 hypothetical protein [Escherichia coli]EKP9378887.1 hypothetical protein [Escherichia coli]EKP9556415.1 hypothetical protein [Escherichia coli]EKP9615766.1 hypothetical protein [Escherichia coli]
MIFNGEMVRAILDGRKTQTRRIMKDQPSDGFHPTHNGYDLDLNAHWYTPGVVDKNGYLQPAKKDVFGVADENEGYTCPFGEVGDRIWVRETFAAFDADWKFPGRPHDLKDGPWPNVIYPASGAGVLPGTLRPSIHMPRWASRLTLEITGVRVERLRDLSEDDAKSEGITPPSGGVLPGWEYRINFRDLWMSIYGADNWEANPWVWVIEFKVVPNVQDNPA